MPAYLALLSLLVCSATFAAENIPTQFVHNRIYVVAPAPDGSTLRLYTDTGGGWNAISKDDVARLILPIVGEAESDDGTKLPLIDFPDFLSHDGVPAPMSEPWLGGHLAQAPKTAFAGDDGVFGSRWFAGRVWMIDYQAHNLSVLSNWHPTERNHSAQVGFRAGADGARKFNFPRIDIMVDGTSIPVLLDTGATARLTNASAAIFHLEPGTKIGASYIVKSMFDLWRAKHPDWRVIEKADDINGIALPMIEVPRVTVATISIGPVWFTQRPDRAFHDGMSPMVDKQIEGAIGGSALHFFNVVLDYPAAMVYFSRNGLSQ